MKTKGRNAEFIAALERELRAAGVPDIKQSREFFRLVATRKTRRKVTAREMLKLGMPAVVTQVLLDSFADFAPKNDAELQRKLKEIEGLGYRLRPALNQAIENMRATLPQGKRGRHPKLTPTQKQAICAAIDALKANGMTIKFAVKQTAEQFHTTARVVRRAWENHGRS